jgi:hypothetical protein
MPPYSTAMEIPKASLPSWWWNQLGALSEDLPWLVRQLNSAYTASLAGISACKSSIHIQKHDASTNILNNFMPAGGCASPKRTAA